MNTPIIARMPNVTGRHQYWMASSGMIGTTSLGAFSSAVEAPNRSDATNRKIPTERFRSVMSWWIVRETWR